MFYDNHSVADPGVDPHGSKEPPFEMDLVLRSTDMIGQMEPPLCRTLAKLVLSKTIENGCGLTKVGVAFKISPTLRMQYHYGTTLT